MADFDIHDHVVVIDYVKYDARNRKIAEFAGKKGMVVEKGTGNGGWSKVNFPGLGTHGFRNYELEKTHYAGPKIESVIHKTSKQKSIKIGREVLVEHTDIKKNKHLEGLIGEVVDITANNMYVLRMPDGEDYNFKRDGLVEFSGGKPKSPSPIRRRRRRSRCGSNSS